MASSSLMAGISVAAGMPEMYFGYELIKQAFHTETLWRLPDIDFVFGPRSLLGIVLFLDGMYRFCTGRGPLDKASNYLLSKIMPPPANYSP